MGSKKPVSVKTAKKPGRPAGKKTPMPDRRQKLIMTAGVVVIVIIAVVLGYSVQKPEFNPPADTSAAATSAPDADQTGTTPPIQIETDNPGVKTSVEAGKPLGAAKQIAINTDKGRIVVEVYPEAMPKTAANFQKLVDSKFYDGLTFHRVEDWVIQGGDPNGNGTGGPGWTIPLEKSPDQLKNVRGALAMARSQDPDTAGSQFYILKKDATSLDGQYAVFGKVIQGMDVVDQIQPNDKMNTVVPYTGK
jgi:peptidyl-prolyl cis-trans isomerase B (cyclophilin B)